MPAAKHGRLWTRYLELCESMDHFDAVKALARETHIRYEELRRIITSLRQTAVKRGEAVPPIPDELLRAARVNGSRELDKIVSVLERPASPPPSQPRDPRAWDPEPVKAILRERGMNPSDLGDTACGLITRRRRYPKIASLQRIADGLGVPLAEVQGDYEPPDNYELMFGKKAARSAPSKPPRPTEPPSLPSKKRKVEPPPGMVAVTSLDDFLRRLPAAADRAQRRRALRLAGRLPFTALQRQVLAQDEGDDTDDKETL